MQLYTGILLDHRLSLNKCGHQPHLDFEIPTIYGDYAMLTKLAVDLSCGELIDIRIKGFGTDKLLDHILRCSHKLKRLSIMYSNDITGSGLGQAVKGRAGHLEELQLFNISNITSQDIEVIGRNCPQLRSLGIVISGWNFPKVYLEMFLSDALAFAIANNMPELRHLKLSNSGMRNGGLKAILNGCPRLQYLDLRYSGHLHLDGSLVKLCMERIECFKHDPIKSFGAFDDDF